MSKVYKDLLLAFIEIGDLEGNKKLKKEATKYLYDYNDKKKSRKRKAKD